jgi:hypothetical protein
MDSSRCSSNYGCTNFNNGYYMFDKINKEEMMDLLGKIAGHTTGYLLIILAVIYFMYAHGFYG